LKWIQPATFGVATIAALAQLVVDGELPSADRTTRLAAVISEWLNTVAFYLLAADALLLLSLIGFTLWRGHSTRAAVEPAGGSRSDH
jgi:hypothetical protein